MNQYASSKICILLKRYFNFNQVEKALGNYTWRIDLCKTEKHWPGWFKGLSNKFLSIHAQKLLLLANIDRMDKDLTVGQMQGNIFSKIRIENFNFF